MALTIDKDWLPLTEAGLARIAGQLGVFELADETHQTVFIGRADAACLFGLKGVLRDYIGKASYYRCEITSAYATRHRELLMVYRATHGELPVMNDASEGERLGRISVSGSH